jgi:hypothetical protein
LPHRGAAAAPRRRDQPTSHNRAPHTVNEGGLDQLLDIDSSSREASFNGGSIFTT